MKITAGEGKERKKKRTPTTESAKKSDSHQKSLSDGQDFSSLAMILFLSHPGRISFLGRNRVYSKGKQG